MQRCQHSLEAQQSDLEEVNQRLEEHKSAEIEYKVHVIHACTGNSVQFWKCGVHFEPIIYRPFLDMCTCAIITDTEILLDVYM